MRSLTLIGMPGSGKSAVGKIVASRMGWNFIDTDKWMEDRYGTRLQALIDRVGDDSFRRLEEETILALATAGQTVISTGGSVVYSDAAMEHLASLSTILFLDVPMDAIRSHIDAEAPRGIVGMKEGGLEELYQDRKPRYERYAELTLHVGSETPEELASDIVTELKYLHKHL